MITYYHINGALVPSESATLGVADLALLRGYGVFDYFLFKKGYPLFIEDYLDRFTRSTALLHLSLPFDRLRLKECIFELIRANGIEEGGIRLLLTGGYSSNGYTPTAGNLLILQYPMPNSLTPAQRTNGLVLLSHNYQREIPEVKTINYLEGIRMLGDMQAAGADDLLYHDNGSIRESVRSNFFIVNDKGILVTPANKILKGITRKKLIKVANEFMPVECREVRLEELAAAKEAFVSSSTKGAAAVVKIDSEVIGSGKPGPICQKIQLAFEVYTDNYLEQHLSSSSSSSSSSSGLLS